MPLSKKRDKERKARIRLEKLISSSLTPKPVQPKMYMAGVEIALPELDAYGNVIPEVTWDSVRGVYECR